MSTLKHDCTDQEHHDWVLENQRYAGGFHYNLIEAWKRADGENKRRLEDAFPYDYRIPLGKPRTRMNTEEFECYLINILDSDELTDTEKVQVIKEQF